jgi:hypothetical protein
MVRIEVFWISFDTKPTIKRIPVRWTSVRMDINIHPQPRSSYYGFAHPGVVATHMKLSYSYAWSKYILSHFDP